MTILDVYFSLLYIAMIGILESRQTINSLLWLVIAFISSAGFFIEIETDIVGLILIIVYVGAIGMFFLFMIMLLNPKASVYSDLTFCEVFLLTISTLFYIPEQSDLIWEAMINEDHWIESAFLSTDLGSMAAVLYEYYGWPLIVLSLLLFKAMLIAIDIARSK